MIAFAEMNIHHPPFHPLQPHPLCHRLPPPPPPPPLEREYCIAGIVNIQNNWFSCRDWECVISHRYFIFVQATQVHHWLPHNQPQVHQLLACEVSGANNDEGVPTLNHAVFWTQAAQVHPICIFQRLQESNVAGATQAVFATAFPPFQCAICMIQEFVKVQETNILYHLVFIVQAPVTVNELYCISLVRDIVVETVIEPSLPSQ